MKPLINRRSKLNLGPNKIVKNRVVVPPMASGTGTADGCVTEKTLEHYRALTQSGAGLITVEYTFVHPTGRSEANQLGLSSDAHSAGLTTLADALRASGALAGIQLTHAGGKSERALTGGVLMAPSAVAVPAKGGDFEVPNAMTAEDITLWKNAFVSAADRAVQAGFDLVELHAAHGYGLNQWLSPITNRRIDEYGRDQRGRRRLLLEIVQMIRRRHPQLLLSVRVPGQEFMEGGLSTDEAVEIAGALERAGVNVISVSSGLGGWRRPGVRTGEGYLVLEAARIQQAVKIPVIGVGGIETGAFIDQALRQNLLSLAAVGRAVLKSPKAWGDAYLREC